MNIRNVCGIIHDKWVDADETVQGRTAQCAIILIVLGALAYIGLTIAASKHLEIDWSNKTVDLCVGSAGALLLGAMLYRIYSTPDKLTEFVPIYDRHSEDSCNSACQGNDQPREQVHLVIKGPPLQPAQAKTVAVDAQPQEALPVTDDDGLEYSPTRQLRQSQLGAAKKEADDLAKEQGCYLGDLNVDYEVYRQNLGNLSGIYLPPPTKGAAFKVDPNMPKFKQVRERLLSTEG